MTPRVVDGPAGTGSARTYKERKMVERPGRNRSVSSGPLLRYQLGIKRAICVQRVVPGTDIDRETASLLLSLSGKSPDEAFVKFKDLNVVPRQLGYVLERLFHDGGQNRRYVAVARNGTDQVHFVQVGLMGGKPHVFNHELMSVAKVPAQAGIIFAQNK